MLGSLEEAGSMPGSLEEARRMSESQTIKSIKHFQLEVCPLICALNPT
jgi:hypothetical protein